MEGRFEFEVAVDDILALLDEPHAERVAMVGLSLVGSVAQKVAYRVINTHLAPDRVR
jgi:esterase/lipase